MNTQLNLDSLDFLDFATDLPCEGTHHVRGLSGHSPTAPGAYMVISPCCGPKVVQCSPRVLAMRHSGVLYCGACRNEHLTSEYTFIPLQAGTPDAPGASAGSAPGASAGSVCCAPDARSLGLASDARQKRMR